MKIRNWLLISALFLVLPVSFAQEVVEKILNNGIKVIVREDHRSPVVVNMVWYKAGSMDELNGTTGVAHVLEHMMFKGTQKYGQGEFSKIVAALGGRDNAFTSYDYTAYFQQIQSKHLEKMMELESDRMQHLLLEEGEFEKEIKVVREERRLRTEDNPKALLGEQTRAAAFIAHPYHRPIIGWMNDLENMKVTDAKAWYDKYYTPKNATIVIVGDVKANDVFALAEKYFGGIESREVLQTRPQIEPEQKGVRRIFVKAPAENPVLYLVFKVPGLTDIEKDTDFYALDTLAAVLAGYDNARLLSKLVREKKIASTISADYSAPSRGPAVFTFAGIPLGKTTVLDLEKAILKEIDLIAQKGISEKELSRVKSQLIASQVYKRDSLFWQAMDMGALETVGIGYQNMERLIEKLKEVTPEQVKAVATKYFKEDSLTVGTLIPLPLEKSKKETAIAVRH